MNALNVEIFEWTHPDMDTPLDVSIAFEGQWHYDSVSNREYESVDPYIEAVYVGNTDIMPLMSIHDLKMCLNDYKQSKGNDND